MNLKPRARAVSDPEPRSGEGLQHVLRVSNSWPPTKRSVTDLHDYKTKIYTSLYFKLTHKQMETFSFSILCKFINFVFYVNLY